MKKLGLLVIAFVLFIPATSYALHEDSLLTDHPDWFTCEENDDCTTITSGKGHCVGVRKDHADQLAAYFEKKQSMKVDGKTPCHEDNLRIACSETICQLVKPSGVTRNK